jgi:mono/diheme cytochrome c family protein
LSGVKRTWHPRAEATLALALTVSIPAHAQITDKQSFEFIEHGVIWLRLPTVPPATRRRAAKPFAGGGAIETPFGTLLAPNITPDVQTGTGGWTDDEFIDAVQNGIGHGGIRLYPAMPYTYYTKMTRADVVAIRAFLNTVQPVHNLVIANQLPFPFDQRESMMGWDPLYSRPGQFKLDPTKSAEWNRGAYLVESAGRCGLCHTPKNAMGGDENCRAMHGSLLQGWYPPNLTANSRVGLGDWPNEDIMLYFKTGRNRFDLASGPMADAITNFTLHLADADLQAIAVHLKSLPASGSTAAAPISEKDPKMQRGSEIYETNAGPAMAGRVRGSCDCSRAWLGHRSCGKNSRSV